MSEGDDNSQRILARIRQELDKLPLTEQQKQDVTPKLLNSVDFLDTDGGQSSPGKLTPDSQLFLFSDKLQALVAHFESDGLTLSGYLAAALKQPRLFYRSPATITGHIEGVVHRFAAQGLTTRQYLDVALKQPQLFLRSPETIAANIEGVVQRFAGEGLTARQYFTAAVKQPPLFYRSPETIAANIEGVVQRFAEQGLTTRQYLAAALKHPGLFTHSPTTIADNIEGVVQRFDAQGLTLRQYLAAAIKLPTLFTLPPATVAGNIESVVQRYAHDGLTMSEYLSAAVRQPSLFCMSPDTVARHIDAVLSFADSGLFTPPIPRRNGRQRAGPSENRTHAAVIDFLLKSPYIMTLADDNFGVREVHQRLTDGPRDRRFFRHPRYAVERELTQHLGHDDPRQPVRSDGFIAGAAPPTEEQARQFVLRALIHAGFIRSGSIER
jgi:hypothetical protein